jgi:hypothetical protein
MTARPRTGWVSPCWLREPFLQPQEPQRDALERPRCRPRPRTCKRLCPPPYPQDRLLHPGFGETAFVNRQGQTKGSGSPRAGRAAGWIWIEPMSMRVRVPNDQNVRQHARYLFSDLLRRETRMCSGGEFRGGGGNPQRRQIKYLTNKDGGGGSRSATILGFSNDFENSMGSIGKKRQKAAVQVQKR